MNPIQTIDYIRILPELVLTAFGIIVMMADPLLKPGASRKGLGLGLYICRELITRQGGQIWLKRQQQKGSVFSFTLPVFSPNNAIVPLLKIS